MPLSRARRVDPGDPQAPELRLAVAPVAVGVHARVGTCSFASAVPLAPRCRCTPWPPSSTSRRFFLAWTERFTRAMVHSLRSASPSSRLIFFCSPVDRTSAHALDPAALAPALLREHVVAGRLPVQHLALARHAEPLRGGAVGLHLRHRSVPHPSLGSGAFGDVVGSACTAASDRRRGLDGRSRRGRVGLRASRGRPCASRLRLLLEVALVGAITMIMLRPSCFGMRLHHDQLAQIVHEPVQDLASELRVRHLASAEHDRDLDLVARPERNR